MIQLKQILIESSGLTPAAAYCKDTILSMPQFSKSKWKTIGTIADRTVGTTNVISQHAYGNAIDWHGAAGIGDPVMQQLTNYLVAKHKEFNVRNVIYNRLIWNLPAGWHKYKVPQGGSRHLDHVHVDFIPGAVVSVSSNSNKLNNTLLQTAISNMEDVIMGNPANWFEQYSSWNPFSSGIGDDELAAANKFIELYEQYVLNAAINKIKNASPEDNKNIKELQRACNTVYNWILNDKTGTVSYAFNQWIPDSRSYVAKTKTFKWDYL